MTAAHEYGFFEAIGRAIKSGHARAVAVTGNVADLFHLGVRDEYVPLLDFLGARCDVAGYIPITYELNGPIRFVRPADEDRLRSVWAQWRTGRDANQLTVDALRRLGRPHGRAATPEDPAQEFDRNLRDATGRPTLALEVLRQLCVCSRAVVNGVPVLADHLVIIIEGADLMVPHAPVAQLPDAILQRVAVCADWFSDLGFLEGGDTVLLCTEARSLLHERVAKMPQLLEVMIPSPDVAERLRFIRWFESRQPAGRKPTYWGTAEELAMFTAALSIHALRQLLVGAAYDQRPLAFRDVGKQVEAFIRAQLGEETVAFKYPEHTRADVIGFRDMKALADSDILPGLRLTTKDALASVIVCGAIGVGKTYFWEALAGELGAPILTLKSIRSKWFGETDHIFGRLRRILEALAKVLIYVEEADTQFGGVGADTHETERRLTGNLQAMMSDPRLRGRVHWILDTARAHQLSPDIRRPGRGGDLISGMFDPEGEDRADFIRWTVAGVLGDALTPEAFATIEAATTGYFAGAFNALRAELARKAAVRNRKLTVTEVLAVIEDTIPPNLGPTRRYQTLQALLNCSRRSLLPREFRNLRGEDWLAQRAAWELELRALEAQGVR